MNPKLINLTPHTVNILTVDGTPLLTIEPSKPEARCKVASTEVGKAGEVPLFRTQYGEVTDLPEPEEGTIYIVSLLIRAALPDRKDLASPGELVRSEGFSPAELETIRLLVSDFDPALAERVTKALKASQGQPKGCKGLVIN